MWNYQEIVYELKPRLVIEFGTFRCGATLFFAHLLSELWNDRSGSCQRGDGTNECRSPEEIPFRVLTVDINHDNADERCRNDDRIEMLEATTLASRVGTRISELRPQFPGPIFAILDSAHNAEHVYGELQLLSPLLRRGDFVVVEDANMNGHPVMPNSGPGPWEAVGQFMTEHPGFFTQDTLREGKFGWTAATGGFLAVA
jgi:cephalosporin hydroxylase